MEPVDHKIMAILNWYFSSFLTSVQSVLSKQQKIEQSLILD